jgi:hypothetical protein
MVSHVESGGVTRLPAATAGNERRRRRLTGTRWLDHESGASVTEPLPRRRAVCGDADGGTGCVALC